MIWLFKFIVYSFGLTVYWFHQISFFARHQSVTVVFTPTQTECYLQKSQLFHKCRTIRRHAFITLTTFSGRSPVMQLQLILLVCRRPQSHRDGSAIFALAGCRVTDAFFFPFFGIFFFEVNIFCKIVRRSVSLLKNKNRKLFVVRQSVTVTVWLRLNEPFHSSSYPWGFGCVPKETFTSGDARRLPWWRSVALFLWASEARDQFGTKVELVEKTVVHEHLLATQSGLYVKRMRHYQAAKHLNAASDASGPIDARDNSSPPPLFVPAVKMVNMSSWLWAQRIWFARPWRQARGNQFNTGQVIHIQMVIHFI